MEEERRGEEGLGGWKEGGRVLIWMERKDGGPAKLRANPGSRGSPRIRKKMDKKLV